MYKMTAQIIYGRQAFRYGSTVLALVRKMRNYNKEKTMNKDLTVGNPRKFYGRFVCPCLAVSYSSNYTI